jgi:phosphoglycolate phosphatase-like HAD superfamily hydrolase
MHKLVLFDIDGTLVLTGRAGVRGMNRALQEVLGVREGLDGIPVAGRTDWAILDEAVRRCGRTLDDALLDELRALYVERLAEEIQHRGEGRKEVLPGVRPLLDELSTRPDVAVGLITGNFIKGAEVKLAHFGLWRFFRFGGFGDDAADRNLLVPFAVDRARTCGVPELPMRDVVVIGDTPADVACAQAVGATAVAVATGGSSVDELRATGADYVLPDLEDHAGFLRSIL